MTEILEFFWKNRVLFLFLPIQGFLYFLPPPARLEFKFWRSPLLGLKRKARVQQRLRERAGEAGVNGTARWVVEGGDSAGWGWWRSHGHSPRSRLGRRDGSRGWGARVRRRLEEEDEPCKEDLPLDLDLIVKKNWMGRR